MTALPAMETFLMLRTPPTAPARLVGPCMQQESSSTTPSSLGRPPRPTESSLGSSSGPFTTRTPASNVSPPPLRNSYAASTYLYPLLAQMMIGRLGESVWDACPCRLASATASRPTEWVFTPVTTAPSMDVFTKSRRENDIGVLHYQPLFSLKPETRGQAIARIRYEIHRKQKWEHTT